ncbi:MAG: XRE family transcriptional regulator, partial [Lachnospiraceae bacterium]|nr:XRE family transcriptional regulator [Lachnospiraceae bacterium]
RLETVLGIPASEWNAMEASYRESLIRAQQQENMEAEIELAQCFPYAEMAKLGWVPETRSVRDKVTYLRGFFEIVDLTWLEKCEGQMIAHPALSFHDKADFTLLAWMQAAKKASREFEVQAISAKSFDGMMPKLRSWTMEKPSTFLPPLREALAARGIALVFVPRIRGLSIQALTFQTGNRIIIAMTEKKMDDHEFWMRLLREMGHIHLGHVWQEDGTTPQDEVDANAWAKNAILPRKRFDVFLEAGSFTEKSILNYAEKTGIAPGIIVGRLQRDGLIGGGALNRLKASFDVSRK